MNDGAALGLVLDQVSKDKNIDRAVLVETLEQAILTAAKRAFGMHREMEAKFNEETGRVDLFQIIVIVEAITAGNEGKEIPHRRTPQRFGLKAEVGDELLFQIFYDEKDQAKAEEQDAKYGELLKLNRAWKGFGRIAAQTAKQVILQRVREAERENVFNEYKDRKGELISGHRAPLRARQHHRRPRRRRGGAAGARAGAARVVPRRRPHRRLRRRHRQGARAARRSSCRARTRACSRSCSRWRSPRSTRRSCASRPRPASRARARRSPSSSRDRDVDPVGACVGMKGSRVQAVVQELRGEKIDIVPYDGDPARFVCNAIAPAEVSRVLIDAGTHTMELIVPDDKLSLAIGKKGQNVRLASQLTGWRIDIHSESKVREMEQRAKQSLAAIERRRGLPAVADALFAAAGARPPRSRAPSPRSWPASRASASVEAAQAIIKAAGRAAEAERVRLAAEAAARAAQQARAGRQRGRGGGRSHPGGLITMCRGPHASIDANLHRLSPARTCGRAGAPRARRGAGPGRVRSARARAGGVDSPREGCVAGALRPGVLSRAFKQPVDMSSDAAELLRQLTAVLRNQGAS